MMSESPQHDEQVPGPPIESLLSMREAAQKCGLSSSHLRLLVRTGQVWGVHLGNAWYTTEEAVLAYLSEGHKPGPKPR